MDAQLTNGNLYGTERRSLRVAGEACAAIGEIGEE